MPRLPTDPFAAAEFLVKHMYRPVGLAAEHFAVAETETPVDGDVWFWSDDNAKTLEFLLRRELWARFRPETLEILRFVRSLCEGPFIFRRVALPRLDFMEAPGAGPLCRHSLLDLRYDPRQRAVVVGIHFHDDRNGDNLVLGGNWIEFTYRHRRFRVLVESTIDRIELVRRGDGAVLLYAAELYFHAGWRERRLGRITYTYALDPGSMPVEAEVALELAPGVRVGDVVLTIAHDRLDRFLYAAVAAQAPGGQVGFAAGKPGRRSLDIAGAAYYQIRQTHISGDALALHSLPREPGRFAGIDVAVEQPGRLHRAVARYIFPGSHDGARLIAAEHKLLTAGGFYDRVGDYARLMREAAARFGTPAAAARDLSVSYDYGVVINAFAQGFVAASTGWLTGAEAGLADEMRSLFDRYLATYCDNWVASHRAKRNAVFSRELAFAVLGLGRIYRATRAAGDLDLLRELAEILLDFEWRFEGVAGEPASGFILRTDSEPTAPVDCHSAALLALTEAAGWTGDPRFIEAIERGLSAYCLETAAVGDRKLDTVSTLVIDDKGRRRTENSYWNFKAGLALRLFRALRESAQPAVRVIAARHADRLALFEFVLRRQLERSLTNRGGEIEIRCSVHSAETNSETQPWVMLGLLGGSAETAAGPDLPRIAALGG